PITALSRQNEAPAVRQPSPRALRAAVIGAALAAQAESRAGTPVLRTLPSGWRNSVMPPEQAVYSRGPDTVTVSYRRQRDDRFAVTVTRAGLEDAATNPDPRMVTVYEAGGGWVDFTEDGQRHRLHVLARGDRVWVQGPDGDVELRAVPRFPQAGPGENVTGGLSAPMPGTVLAVHAAAGDTVTGGQLLMIVEAMKMEHRITAPH